MTFDTAYLVGQFPALWRGLLMTLQVSLVAMALSVVIGIAGAAVRQMRVPVLSQFAFAYVELIRNTPLLVQIFFVFYGLPAIGLRLSLYWSGVAALAVWAGAFQVENIRGGLTVVGPGLRDAGLALGLRPIYVLMLVALPLALRLSVPAMLNTAVSLLKNSAYLQAIGLKELTFVAVDRISSDFRVMEMFAVLLVVYVALVFALSAAVGSLERWLRRPFVP